MENQNDGEKAREKITNFFVSRECTEIGKFIFTYIIHHPLLPTDQLFNRAMLDLLVCLRHLHPEVIPKSMKTLIVSEANIR